MNRVLATSVLLIAAAAGLSAYKMAALGISPADATPVRSWRVTLSMSLDGGSGSDVSVRTFLPANDDRQRIFDEESDPGGLEFENATGADRVGRWSGANIRGARAFTHSFSSLGEHLRFDIDPTLTVPDRYPEELQESLEPTPDIQSESPEIAAALEEIRPSDGTVLALLRAIQHRVTSLESRPFKGTTDALTALKLGEASCNGRSRLFAALARRAHLPARLVGGVILESGTKRVGHQWVEVWVAGRWIPFCPTNGWFAEIPAHYLTLYHGDHAAFSRTADVRFDYAYKIRSRLMPSPGLLESWAEHPLNVMNVWDAFHRVGIPLNLLKIIVMIPVGALVTVLLRNVVGLEMFGTFLPALLAAAARETGLLWGIAGFMIVLSIAAGARSLLSRYSLLHAPKMAILLVVVVTTILALTAISVRLGFFELAHVSLFPIAILAITSERFCILWEENGFRRASTMLAQTLVAVSICYAAMASLALQVLFLGFPELLLVVIALSLWLGRWTGIRLREVWRFRSLLPSGVRA